MHRHTAPAGGGRCPLRLSSTPQTRRKPSLAISLSLCQHRGVSRRGQSPKLCGLGRGSPGSSAPLSAALPAPDTGAAPAPPPFPTIPTCWDPLGLLHSLPFGALELFLLPRAHPELIPPRRSASCLEIKTFPRPAPPAVPPQLSESQSPDAGCHLLEESKRFHTANFC